MENSNLRHYKEKAVKEFVLESFRGMFFYFNIFKQIIMRKSLQKYSSIIIACISDLVDDDSIVDICNLGNYLRSDFFNRMSNFDKEDTQKNLEKLEKIEKYSQIIAFYIWCVDSFYYFLKDSLSSYKILKDYSTFIDYVISDKKSNDTILDLTESFYKQILAD